MPAKTIDGNMSTFSLLNKRSNHNLQFFVFIFTTGKGLEFRFRILSIDRIASKTIDVLFNRQEVNRRKLS